MPFIQIVEYRSSDPEAVWQADREWEQATEGRRTTRRIITTRDRNDPNHFMDIIFFDSYESAMENSNLPETSAVAKQFESLTDGPLKFYDLDVVEDRS